MVESMIERVARGLADAEFGKGAPLTPDDLFRARAAIEAMREPTDAMVDALTSYDSNPESLYERAIDAALNEQVSG